MSDPFTRHHPRNAQARPSPSDCLHSGAAAPSGGHRLLADLLELATQFRGTRCIVARIFSPVVIAQIPLHLEGRHVGGQSCCTSRSGTNAGLWTPRPQRPLTIDLPQTYESCRIVDVIPALPPVVSHWHLVHLVRQLRPTLDAACGWPPARLRELHTLRESADGLIEGPENQKPRKSLNLRGFAIISGGERGIRTPDRRLTDTAIGCFALWLKATCKTMRVIPFSKCTRNSLIRLPVVFANHPAQRPTSAA
ncbi:hypothetical protein [Burkholderia gladioli]|uniref:hypothetical protein n=1 Tax=Burkholderia gladioli TaxID=28095 RepID=UPI001C5F3557|nr:hypothetical protein [Burkholderia gladioli]MBW5285987.1 hypothetical protein [Burkholderia gladioli]